VFDFLLMGLYPSEEDIEAVQKGLATRPIGKPRPVASMPWPPKVVVVPEETAPDSSSER
jgi:penicillin-binding protein 2